MNNTKNLQAFGYRELDMAVNLLIALRDNKWASAEDCEWMGKDTQIEFNSSSGFVFLSDRDGNASMINNKGYLESWLINDDDKEGFRSELCPDKKD
jgi:hypothetical protein